MQTQKEKRGFLYCDIAAVVCGLALFSYFFATARLMIGSQDELFYFTVPQRILQGDLFFIHEWHFSQLSLIFNILPYWVYTAVTGGTQGLILCMRYLYIAVDLIFYAYLYVKLRRFRFAGLVSALFFCALFPQAICSGSYYLFSTMAFTALCVLLLVDSPRAGAVKTLFAGVLLACAVLAEPLLIFVFLLYFLLVVLRALSAPRHKLQLIEALANVLNTKTFLLLLAGAFSVFTVFMAYLLFSGTLRRLPEVLPYLLKDTVYTGAGLFNGEKLSDAVGFFGALPLVGLLLSVCACAAYRIMKKKSRTLRFAAFTALCAFAALCYVHAAFSANYMLMVEFHEVPVLFFGPAVCLLCDEKNSRIEALAAAGLLFSFFVDLSSANVLGSGGKIVFIACALRLPVFLRELFAPVPARGKTGKKPARAPVPRAVKALVFAAAGVSCLCFFLWNAGFVYCEGFMKPENVAYAEGEDASLKVTLERGPYKGIVTTEKYAGVYGETLNDLDLLKSLSGGAPVAGPERLLYAYLYLDLPYGVPTAWYPLPNGERYTDYWELYPEKRPAYFYVPMYDTASYEYHAHEKMLEWLSGVVRAEPVEGARGRILKVTGYLP